MPTETYELIAQTTLAASASEVTFGSLPQTYRDLVLVVQAGNTATTGIGLRFNSDSGNNYPNVHMYGTTSGPTGNTQTVSYATVGASIWSDTSSRMIYNISIMDYSATDKHKTLLYRSNSLYSSSTEAGATRWANTSAITSIQVVGLGSSQSVAGSTFALYGIAS